MPATRYAYSGDVRIAYQVTGDGPRDLVYVPGWISNVEVMWEDPGLAQAKPPGTVFSPPSTDPLGSQLRPCHRFCRRPAGDTGAVWSPHR